jgi:hypothetical protein
LWAIVPKAVAAYGTMKQAHGIAAPAVEKCVSEACWRCALRARGPIPRLKQMCRHRLHHFAPSPRPSFRIKRLRRSEVELRLFGGAYGLVHLRRGRRREGVGRERHGGRSISVSRQQGVPREYDVEPKCSLNAGAAAKRRVSSPFSENPNLLEIRPFEGALRQFRYAR